ncbi:hypothetical protein BOX15_Mlig006521g1 [Macrostomum lignano]|uniref:Uncharacterized protein n=1 Tax=Macrostomum lignano TaxID=282301 RepID=A0A267EC20_9PLAT|nr:hypothetical protein BOX15_Mlig006521g1 [Macrostomum lignano]
MSGPTSFPDFRPTELSLLCSEAESQMQRTLKGLHQAILVRQAALRRAARRSANEGAQDNETPEMRRRRLLDELRHGQAMAELAARQGDTEEAAYRAERERQLKAELDEAESEANQPDGGWAVGVGVNKNLLSAAFTEAVDEFQTQLLAELRQAGSVLAEQEVKELAADSNLGL